MLSIIIILAFDIFFWSVSWSLGVIGILALLGFIIAYALAEEIALSPRDFFWNSEWGVFCKKIGWAWSVALIVYAVSYLIMYFITNW
ncbi:MAG: hypothetical protein K2L31_11020 [Muribaculum sp.]|nr:hypothetical protein [Muribaculum sp.]MDE6459110.1 hypothetical protein [Muribaculum sp.]